MISLRHVGLIVSDIDLSLQLYKDVLGFIPKIDQIESGIFYEHLTGINDGIARTCKCYAHDGTCIELIQYISHKESNRKKNLLSSGFNHIALNVNDIDNLEKKLLSINVRFINEPKLNDSKNAKVAFCYDFEDNLIELVQVYE